MSNRFANIVGQMAAQRETEDGPPPAIIPGDETTLSESETAALTYYERVIEQGLRAFLEAGKALLVINRERLYRASHSDFYSYCAQRWGIQKSQAYRLMDASEVVANLSPIGDTLPANEAQARPLVKLKEPDQQREAWERVVQRAEGARITARLVEQVVDELLAAQAPPAAPAPRSVPAGGTALGAQGTPSSPIIDLEALPDEEVAPAPPDEVSSLRAALAEAQSRQQQALDILHEYQEHITRAQKYKPTSERGEAVSPLLRAIERVYTLLREGQAGRE